MAKSRNRRNRRHDKTLMCKQLHTYCAKEWESRVVWIAVHPWIERQIFPSRTALAIYLLPTGGRDKARYTMDLALQCGRNPGKPVFRPSVISSLWKETNLAQ
jgi:hypothetical protein